MVTYKNNYCETISSLKNNAAPDHVEVAAECCEEIVQIVAIIATMYNNLLSMSPYTRQLFFLLFKLLNIIKIIVFSST